MYKTGYHQVDIKITECDTTGCLELKHGGEPSQAAALKRNKIQTEELYLFSTPYLYTNLFSSHKDPTYLVTFLNFELNKSCTQFKAKKPLTKREVDQFYHL